MGRWDYLYDQKPRAAVDVLIDEAAKAFADDLARWPLPLEEVVTEPGVCAVVEGPRPHPLVWKEAFHLLRLDLRHDYEELDRWERDELWKQNQLTAEEKTAAWFLFRYAGEQVYGLSEAVRSRVPRGKLVDLVDLVEKRVLAPSIIA